MPPYKDNGGNLHMKKLKIRYRLLFRIIPHNIVDMSNNKINLAFQGAFAYTQEGNAQFVNSNLDALLAYANDFDPTSVVAGFVSEMAVDTSYLYNTTTVATKVVVDNAVVRQDAQVIIPVRLPQATENNIGVIVSSADAFKSYFYNSVAFSTNTGIVRVGIINFTASQPTNPFAPGQQSVLNAIWSFLDVPKA
jgi:hypothetical protein